MDESLLGYLLDSLDPATQERVESQLRNDPQARRRLELLHQVVAPLEEDRDIEPPPDLVIKTLALVAEHCCRQLPRLAPPAPRSVPAAPPFWRRADVLVAAALLLAVMTFGFPMISRLRHQSAVVECKDNLREYYLALAKYSEMHNNNLPNFAAQTPPRNVAGMVAPILHDAGVLPSSVSIWCPATRSSVPCTVTLARISALTDEEFQKEAPLLIPCYAYSLGYRDENGTYHYVIEWQGEIAKQSIPIMADCPPTTDLTNMRNSPNHGGFGQNILFLDGHVEFAGTRKVGMDDDIFLNNYKKVAAGIGSSDVVLGSSASRP